MPEPASGPLIGLVISVITLIAIALTIAHTYRKDHP